MLTTYIQTYLLTYRRTTEAYLYYKPKGSGELKSWAFQSQGQNPIYKAWFSKDIVSFSLKCLAFQIKGQCPITDLDIPNPRSVSHYTKFGIPNSRSVSNYKYWRSESNVSILLQRLAFHIQGQCPINTYWHSKYKVSAPLQSLAFQIQE